VTAISPLQLKLARTALGLGIRELAQAASVSPTTISRFEAGRSTMLIATLDRLQTTLEQGGVIFIAPDAGGGAGVRLRS
jgi:transcriptional regulator with XRE-family HTH domain